MVFEISDNCDLCGIVWPRLNYLPVWFSSQATVRSALWIQEGHCFFQANGGHQSIACSTSHVEMAIYITPPPSQSSGFNVQPLMGI